MPSTDEIIPYLRKIDESKWYSNFGPLNDQFVSRLAEYFAVPIDNLCLIGNATLGLQAVAEVLDVKTSTTFEIPSFTFAASPSALISARRKIRFIDVDQDMRCTPTKSAQVVMDVLPFGESVRVESWMSDLDFLIIDAAASFDALKGFGQVADFGCEYALVVSFHSTKLLGAGEGGVIIASSSELIADIKLWQNFGFDAKGGSQRISLLRGTNAKMSEFNCAVGLASLDQWEHVRLEYARIQSRAIDISNSLGFKTHTAMANKWVNPYWILVPDRKETTIKIQHACKLKGFETRLWWQSGCKMMPAFEDIESEGLPNTMSLCDRYVGLPFHLQLTDSYWNNIWNLLKEVSP
jgi:dTDP-4-amino-4,6-dideoxygalactose transaminase